MARVAAIDCGTNSIRLLVADVDRTGAMVRDVHRDMRIVRLGQGVDATGRLAPPAIERTRVALADFTAILRSSDAERIRMVATSATRDAANKDDFFAMVRATLGAEAEVISGDEEAVLSFAGAVRDLDPAGGPFLVVDVGGGSTEFVLGTADGAGVTAAASVDIGCVRLTERCLRSDPPTAAELVAAERLVREVFEAAFDAVPVAEARTWVGLAGTMTQLSSIVQRLPTHDPSLVHLSRLSHHQLRAVSAELLGMTHAQRAANPAIHPGRVDIIGAGSLIVRLLADELYARAGIRELVVSEHDILDGIALSIA